MVSGARFIVAGTLLYAVLRWRGVPAPTRRQWPSILVMGATLLLLGNGMVVLAERDVSSGLAATAVASVPLWMALFSAMRGQHASRGEWLGIVIGFLGVVWLNAGSSLTATPTGLVLLLIAPLGWAFGSIWSRGRDLPSPFMTAAAQMICGGVLIVLAGLAIGERPHQPAEHARPAGRRLPVCVRLDRGLHGLCLAAAQRASGLGRQLCLRQPGDRGGVGRLARA